MKFESKQQLTDEELERALEECAKEPIHIPGSIQPYGMLFVVDEAEMRIEQLSNNMETWLGRAADDLLGEPISDVIGAENCETIHHIIQERSLQPIQSTVIEVKEQLFDVVAHRYNSSIVIELEIVDDIKAQSRDYFYDELREFAVGMRDTRSPEELYQYITNSIQKITNFDRVKLYKFDEDWNGEVIAESKKEYMPSYKGLRFPASDIPEQARKLYMQNFIRQITDINDAPVPLIPQNHPGSGAPLDMTYSVLRSVSPVHIQYLENMKVMASMSITVIQDGRFWGLIACHHNSPYHVPYRIRICSEIMGHIFSSQLSTMEKFVDSRDSEKRKLLLERLSASLGQQFRLEDLISSKVDISLGAMKADGIAIVKGSMVAGHGHHPEADQINNLAEWLFARESTEIFHTHEAEKALKGVPELAGLQGGFLACPISRLNKEFIIWFRKCIKEEVSWAGKPEKSVEETRAGFRLTPRASFSIWKDTVRNRSKAWSKDDITTATSIVNIVLESERHQAEHASIAKSEFLANMSHELRTPMNAIIGIINILNKDTELNQKQKEFINTLNISSQSLLQLINDLLDISKIEANEMELEKIDFNLAELIEEVRSLMHVRAQEKDIVLNIKYPGKDQLDIKGDQIRLRQVILNLVSNAIKFTEDGFVNLIVRLDDEDESKFHIDVSDTGIGMTETQLANIFDKFVQADESVSRKYGGTGLGLSITRHLVQLMGGEIKAQSQYGMGSRFTVTLPLAKAAEKPCQAEPAAPAILKDVLVPDGPRKRILLAEDYQGNIVVALTLLQSLGYDVIVVENGKEAINKLESDNFDLVLMDVQMPVMDGYTATKLIRNLEGDGEIAPIKIIGMTAHALAGDRQKCLDAGMDDYISKPFDPAHLEALLDEYCG